MKRTQKDGSSKPSFLYARKDFRLPVPRPYVSEHNINDQHSSHYGISEETRYPDDLPHYIQAVSVFSAFYRKQAFYTTSTGKWDLLKDDEFLVAVAFQSTHPEQGGTFMYWMSLVLYRPFQSTHPERGGTLLTQHNFRVVDISIHPPRAGWDVDHAKGVPAKDISIHPPRAGWDAIRAGYSAKTAISIHPPRAGWDVVIVPETAPVFNISIHPPRAGWGVEGPLIVKITDLFQSTHPERGGTYGVSAMLSLITSSIHPPRAGWDGIHNGRMHGAIGFQSTHPARGGTP